MFGEQRSQYTKFELLFLVYRLLNYACISNCQLPGVENLLQAEMTWLKKIKVTYSNSCIFPHADVCCFAFFFDTR